MWLLFACTTPEDGRTPDVDESDERESSSGDTMPWLLADGCMYSLTGGGGRHVLAGTLLVSDDAAVYVDAEANVVVREISSSTDIVEVVLRHDVSTESSSSSQFFYLSLSRSCADEADYDWMARAVSAVPWNDEESPDEDPASACWAAAVVAGNSGTLVVAGDPDVGLTGFFVGHGDPSVRSFTSIGSAAVIRSHDGTEIVDEIETVGTVSSCDLGISGAAVTAVAEVPHIGWDAGEAQIRVEVEASEKHRFDISVRP